jgi:hypothetical protein
MPKLITLQEIEKSDFKVGPNFQIARDGGTVMAALVINGEIYTLFQDGRTESTTRGDFYLYGYPGNDHSKYLGKSDVLTSAIDDLVHYREGVHTFGIIKTKKEALEYLDTDIRKYWQDYLEKNPELGSKLGKAEIKGEIEVYDRKAWEYFIEGLPVPLDGTKYYFLDNKEAFQTSINEDENTPEKAFQKRAWLGYPIENR